MKKRLSLSDYYEGILSKNRVILGKAITLIESALPEDEALAGTLLTNILPHTGNSIRVGITGVPGVGKSTFIEAFGNHLLAAGKKLAVLTIDPSSQLTHGSILGDKTRMESLSKNPMAFIRPSAAGAVLGGVAHKTREAMLLCEAAGFDVIIVETVGTGQSETAVKNMVDFFLLLMLAGAGDELQGIKKGIMEMADALVITKADGDNAAKAILALAEYEHALHLFQAPANGWMPKVYTCSALENKGLDAIWLLIQDFKEITEKNSYFQSNREEQNVQWMFESFNGLVRSHIQQSPSLQRALKNLEIDVRTKKLSPLEASRQLLRHFLQAQKLNE